MGVEALVGTAEDDDAGEPLVCSPAAEASGEAAARVQLLPVLTAS